MYFVHFCILEISAGSVLFSFGSDEHEFRRKEHEFLQKLTTARIIIEAGNGSLIGDKWINLYKMNTSSLDNVAALASSLGIAKIGVFRPQLSVVSVKLPSASVEHEFLQKLKEADIPVLWEHKQPTEYPRDQDYTVVASLQSAVEKIADNLGITKYSKPKYVSVIFTLKSDKIEFLRQLKKAGINLKERKRIHLKPVRAFLVEVQDMRHIRTIAQRLNISDIEYNMTPLSAVSVAFTFRSDEYEFHQKLDEANISFEVNEADFWEHPKVNEYIVEASLIPQVQEIATKLSLDVS